MSSCSSLYIDIGRMLAIMLHDRHYFTIILLIYVLQRSVSNRIGRKAVRCRRDLAKETKLIDRQNEGARIHHIHE